jgi:hypothetical protein
MDLARKLQIKLGTKLALLNAPKGMAKALEPLPEGVRLLARAKAAPLQAAIVFCTDQKEVNKFALKAAREIEPDGLLWLCFPKGSSGEKTDISRDKGWEELENLGLRPVRAVSIDDTWSTLRWRPIEAVN